MTRSIGWIAASLLLACPAPTDPPVPDLGPVPPSGLTITAQSFDVLVVSWDATAQALDGYEVEVKVGASEWSRAHDGVIPRASTSLIVELDPSTPDLAPILFRIRSVRNGVAGSLDNQASYARGLRPPANVAVIVEPAGARVSWTNGSQAATAIQVRRWPDGTRGIATLSVEATGYLDARVPIWPSSRWAVVAVAGTPPRAESAETWIGISPFDISGPARPLYAAVAPVLWTLALRRSGDGTFVYLGGSTDSPAVVIEGAAGSVQHALSASGLIWPFLLLDGSGRPHVLTYSRGGSILPPLVHEWLGDSGWASETLAPLPGLGTSTQWGLDDTGALQVLSDEEVCSPAGSAWACEPVPDPPGYQNAMSWGLRVARDGTTLLGTTYTTAGSAGMMSIATRRPGAVFEVENVPLDCGDYPEMTLIPDTGGDLALLCQHGGVRYAERRGGRWSAFEEVGVMAVQSRFGAAAMPGLSRVELWAEVGDLAPTLELWSRGPTGWTGSSLAPSGVSQIEAGYLDDGRFWLAAAPADHSYPATEPFSLWEEP